MNKNKNISDKQLQEIFKGITLDTPSSGFIENLMTSIEKEAAHEKKKKSWIMIGQIAAGISSMILLPSLILYLCVLFIPEFTISFSFPKISLNFDPNLITIGLAVLLLLIGDTLCRKHLHSKKNALDN
jgi:hypothetical protein